MTRNSMKMPALLASAALLCGVSSALAQSAPSLGSAQSFALLGGQTVTVAAVGSIITGDVGTSPGTSITGIPAGGTVVAPFATHSSDSAAISAQAVATAVYTELATTGGATAITAELGGTTLTPGVYSFSSSANIAATTTLTLDGEGVYIFQVGSAITANVHSRVDLINGAAPCQVFWQVTSAATLNGVNFPGTVVAQAAITLGVNAVLQGRAWTTAAGAVTLAGNNRVGCSSGFARTSPTLGAGQNFALLGGQTVTVAAIGTVITGNVGTSPGTSITGIPAGGTVVAPFTTHSTDSVAIAAQAAATALYVDLVITGGAQPILPELGGTTLTPGVYSFSSSANIAATTTLTLDGAGIYIFQVGSAITANVHSNVNLINGALPCQIFWQVTSAATLNGVYFAGTVVAQAGVTMGVDAVLEGRAWTTAAGAVTLAGNNRVSCSNICATYAPAAVDTFGFGCYSPEPLEFVPSSLPVMGTVGTADIRNVPTQTAAVTIGFTGLPAGVDLSVIGMPGCMLWHSNEHPGFATSFLSPTSMRFYCHIPQNCSLVGIDMFLQAYCYAPGANALGLVTSNGLKWSLGF